MAWRMRARHRLREPETAVDRAGDAEIVALLRACRSARDRLIVLLMARAGLRRGEVCGLRRSDVHLLPDSRVLGCEVARAHLHVVRRDNPNGAWAKSRRQRVVPLDFLVVQAFDGYEFERLAVPRAGESDFVLVNLFREPVGAPMRPDAINELMAAARGGPGWTGRCRPHQLRHAFGSNLADAGGGLDEIAELLGHASMSSSQVYLHPDPARLREAVDRVPSPRELCRDRTGERAPKRCRSAVAGRGTHVFADTRIDRHAAAVAAVIDPAFLTEAGWDPARRVLSLDPEHPLLGRPVCRAAGCSTPRRRRRGSARRAAAGSPSTGSGTTRSPRCRRAVANDGARTGRLRGGRLRT